MLLVLEIGEDENIREDKHLHAVNKNATVSGDDVMAANKNYAVCLVAVISQQITMLPFLMKMKM
ncbi:disease resistance protein [Trifolium medium]|uniref:Disease resistance protein n=1 Tax=Trifolium medium TaxID=97028 RepID=A0A392SFT1_9FABA|nr:disease resistance protein [Trifolium medium]